MASPPSAPTQLPNGNWSYTNAKGQNTTGTKDSVQSQYDIENPPAPSTAATGRYPSTYTPPTPGSAAVPDKTQAAETTYINATNPEDPAAITTRIQGEYSAEIQAIKSYYDQLAAQQTIVNTNESGKTRATAAATGELGSDMGNAALAERDKANQQNMSLITSAGANAVGGVLDKEATAIEGEITGEKSTQQSALAGDITFKQNQASKAQAQMQTIAAATDLADLPQNEYDSLYEASGFSTPDQFNQYYEAVRASAKSGGKTIGDATAGVWQQQVDGTWKNIIKGASQGMIGTPDTGVWQKNTDGTYTNVIPAPAKSASAGSMIYNPTTGKVETAGSKIITSGGVLYSVSSNNVATPLTANKIGWTATGSASDQEKAAILSYANSLGLSKSQYTALITSVKTNPEAYFTALGNAAQSSFYTPINLGGGLPGSTTGDKASTDASTAAADAAAASAQDAADAADNANADSGTTP